MSARLSRPAARITAATFAAALTGGLLVAGAGSTQAAPAAPTAPAAPSVAQDHDRRGDCGPNARYDADVERDDGRLETSFEIDGAERGEKWRITMQQNGDRFFKQVRTTDFEREIDVERNRPDTRGTDTFKFVAKKVGGGGKCSVTLTR